MEQKLKISLCFTSIFRRKCEPKKLFNLRKKIAEYILAKSDKVWL